MATNRKLIGFDPENFAARIETKCAASMAKENKLGVEIPSPSRYWSVSTFHDGGTDGEAKALLTSMNDPSSAKLLANSHAACLKRCLRRSSQAGSSG